MALLTAAELPPWVFEICKSLTGDSADENRDSDDCDVDNFEEWNDQPWEGAFPSYSLL